MVVVGSRVGSSQSSVNPRTLGRFANAHGLRACGGVGDPPPTLDKRHVVIPMQLALFSFPWHH